MTTTIDADLRAWAKDHLPTEAATELLITAGLTTSHLGAWIEPTKSGHFVHRTKLAAEAGAWSGQQQAIARIAVSLLGGDPVHLDDVLPGLSPDLLSLVLAAVSHAAGAHETTTGTPHHWPTNR